MGSKDALLPKQSFARGAARAQQAAPQPPPLPACTSAAQHHLQQISQLRRPPQEVGQGSGAPPFQTRVTYQQLTSFGGTGIGALGKAERLPATGRGDAVSDGSAQGKPLLLNLHSPPSPLLHMHSPRSACAATLDLQTCLQNIVKPSSQHQVPCKMQCKVQNAQPPPSNQRPSLTVFSCRRHGRCACRGEDATLTFQPSRPAMAPTSATSSPPTSPPMDWQ